ncbi:MAG TPA: hypothetical protein VL971_07665, partial [Rhizomicrobium sp.]|nr:hypothetical protein [Rhizomicrobium sp.]
QKETIRQSKETAKPQVGISRYIARSIDDRVDAVGRHANRFGQPVLAHPDLIEKFRPQNFSRMRISKRLHRTLHSMIVYNFHIDRFAGVPSETNSPLIVDTDAVLSLSPAAQRFQPVARRIAQVADR